MPQQTQSPTPISTSVLDKFRALDPEKRKIALSRMSDAAKQALLGEINAAKTATSTAPNDHTTLRNTGPAPDPRTGGEVLYDQTMDMVGGIPKAITGLPNAALGAAKLAWDAATGKPIAQQGVEILKGVTEPITTPIRGALALGDAHGLTDSGVAAPTPQEWESAASNLGTEIGGAILGGATKIAGNKVMTPYVNRSIARADNIANARSTNSLAVLSSPGVKAAGRDVRFVAESTAPWYRAAFDKVGIDPAKIPTTGSTKNAPTGALTVGGSMEDVDKIVKYRNSQLKPGETPVKASNIKSVPLEMADIMVDEIHAPIEAATKQFNRIRDPQLVQKIADDLYAKGQEALDAGQMNLYLKLSEKVRKAETIGDIMELKAFANKKAAPIFDKGSPGAAAEATAQSSFAYRDLGDIIRAETYPWMEQRGVKGLIEQGRLEADALDVKDGIYLTHGVATRAEAVAALESWVNKYGTDVVRSSYFAKAAALDTIRKALEKAPQATFNTLIRDAASVRPRGGLKSHITVRPAQQDTGRLLPERTAFDMPAPEDASGSAITVPWENLPRSERLALPEYIETVRARPYSGPSGEPIITPPPAQPQLPSGRFMLPERAGGPYQTPTPESMIERAAREAGKGQPIVIKEGPAKGMSLDRVELDPVTRQPKRYIYISQNGRRLAFEKPQK